MKKQEYVKMVASALTHLTQNSIEKDNSWLNVGAKTSIECLTKSIALFFEEETNNIYVNSNINNSRFNLPTSKFIDLSNLFDTPLDFVIAVNTGIVEYLMTNAEKDSSSDKSLEPPLT